MGTKHLQYLRKTIFWIKSSKKWRSLKENSNTQYHINLKTASSKGNEWKYHRRKGISDINPTRKRYFYFPNNQHIFCNSWMQSYSLNEQERVGSRPLRGVYIIEQLLKILICDNNFGTIWKFFIWKVRHDFREIS